MPEPSDEGFIAELLLCAVALDENFAGPRTLACGRLLMRFLYDDGTLEAQLEQMVKARQARET